MELATNGVQLATASSKAQKAQQVIGACRGDANDVESFRVFNFGQVIGACRGDAPVLAQRYKRRDERSRWLTADRLGLGVRLILRLTCGRAVRGLTTDN